MGDAQRGAAALFMEGVRHEKGRGVPVNHAEAARLYREATELGHADAWKRIGLCYRTGQGVEKDEKEAFRCLHEAARQGGVLAQLMVAAELSEGRVNFTVLYNVIL